MKYKFLIGILCLIPFPIYSQTGVKSGFNIYIYNTYMDDSGYTKKIPISYSLYYPTYKAVRLWITLDRKKPLIKIKVENNNIAVEGNSLLVQAGDTLFTRVVGNNKQIEFLTQNNKLYFYEKMLESKNNHQEYEALSKLLNDTPFNYKLYQQKVFNYYLNECNFIENYFLQERKLIKERLLNTVKNQELISLLQPLINGFVKEIDYIGNEDSIVNASIKRIAHFQSAYLDNPTYRQALLYINAYKSKIIINKTISPNQYDILVSNAKRNFSNDVYLFIIATYHRSITRDGNVAYKPIADKIYAQLVKANFDLDSRRKIDSMNRRFELMNININHFGEELVKDKNGTILKLNTLLTYGSPILLDFWATWCGPCIEEFSYLDSLKKWHPDLNVICLSIDKDEKKWLNFVKGKTVSSIPSLLLVKSMQSKIIRTYSIQTVPRYMLFDGKGNCLSLDFTRPSEKIFKESLKNYLQ